MSESFTKLEGRAAELNGELKKTAITLALLIVGSIFIVVTAFIATQVRLPNLWHIIGSAVCAFVSCASTITLAIRRQGLKVERRILETLARAKSSDDRHQPK